MRSFIPTAGLKIFLHIYLIKSFCDQLNVPWIVPGTIRSETKSSWKPAIECVWIKKFSSKFDHNVFHTGIRRPFSIRHLVPLHTRSLALQMILHVWLGFLPKAAAKKSCLGKYFALRTQNTRAFDYDISFQSIFPNRELLKSNTCVNLVHTINSIFTITVMHIHYHCRI